MMDGAALIDAGSASKPLCDTHQRIGFQAP